MAKKIDFGETNLSDLHQIFNFDSTEAMELKSARLFPNGNVDNETATTSIFLASLSAVKEYREELLSGIKIGKLSARNAALHVYTEIDHKENGSRPDGLIVITSGKHVPIVEWACFVESKVKDNAIEETQIERYAEFAREVGINDIITISNHLATNPFDSPVKLKKRRFNLYHWSWTYLKITASRLIRNNAIKDEDHIYILKELRRFFDAHRNLSDYQHMGKKWKDAVNKIHNYQVDQKIEPTLLDQVIDSYKQEEKDVSLQLTDKSGLYVELLANEDRTDEILNSLQASKIIISEYFINNDRKNKFSIEIDFIRQKIVCRTILTISKGKAQAQTSALIKMFEDIGATSHIIVNAFYNRKKSATSDITLSQLIEERQKGVPYSVLDKSFGEEIKTFEIKTDDLLGKDFHSVGNFIIKLESIAYRFLTQVMMNK